MTEYNIFGTKLKVGDKVQLGKYLNGNKLLIFILSLAFYSEGIISNLNILPSVQTFPLIFFIAFLFFWVVFLTKIRFTKTTMIIFIIFLYLNLISILNLFISNFEFLQSFLRQNFSFFLGICLLVLLSYLFRNFNKKEIKLFVLYGLYTLFILDILEFIVKGDRTKGYILFSEPSHQGYYLSLIVVPFLILNKSLFSVVEYVVVWIVTLVALLTTFSTTAFYAMFMIIVGLVIVHLNNIKFIFKASVVVVFLIFILYVILFILYPDNYARGAITYFIEKLLYDPDNLYNFYSFGDRWQIFFVIPHILSNINEFTDLFLTLLGRGLGSEIYYFYEIFPQDFEFLFNIKASCLLTSFQSKIFIYGGIFLFLLVFFIVLILVKYLWRRNKKLAGIILGIYISSFSLLGALTFPIIWFWLAYIDNLKKFTFEEQNNA